MLNDLKDLEKFLKICRKQGVSEISHDGVSVKFGDLPSKTSTEAESDEVSPDELTPEQLMFYAVNNTGNPA